MSAESLAEHVSASKFKTLDRLALASGVPVQILEGIDTNSFTPDDEMLHVLATSLPSYRHARDRDSKAEDLPHERTRAIPDGMELLSLTAKEVVAGDQVSYSPRSRRSVVAWVKVERINLTARYNNLYFANGNWIRIPILRPVRVLRASASA